MVKSNVRPNELFISFRIGHHNVKDICLLSATPIAMISYFISSSCGIRFTNKGH